MEASSSELNPDKQKIDKSVENQAAELIYQSAERWFPLVLFVAVVVHKWFFFFSFPPSSSQSLLLASTSSWAMLMGVRTR
jgi:hypothetical protein